MSSPNPPHNVHLEVFVNGAWTDISGDFLSEAQPAQITRGYSSETSKSVDPGNMSLILDDRSKNYSPRNPNSIYYGSIKRNMPVRLSVITGGTQYRAWMETAGLTPTADKSGKYLTTTLEAGGILRRLKQGNQIVQSLPRAYIPTTNPTAYWPLEDGILSTTGIPIAGGNPWRHVGAIPQNWGGGTLAPWLPNGLQGVVRAALTEDSNFVAAIPPQGVSTGWTLDYYVNGRTDYSVNITQASKYGSTDSWGLSMSPSINSITVTPPNPGFISGGGPITYTHDGLFHHIRVAVVENFVGDANFSVLIDGVLVHSGHVTATAPEPVIDVLGIEFRMNDEQPTTHDMTRVTIGHVAFWANVTPPAIATMVAVAYGNPGEAASTRISRICTTQGITLTTIGTLAATRPCGPQYTIGIIDLLQESADVDGGFLYETLGGVGLTYQTLDATYNQAITLPLTYTTNHHLGKPLAPVDDDQTLRNDVTVTRKGAGSQEVRQLTGPLQITAPPAGVGSYTDPVTINCLTDDQARDHAGWRALNLGTVDAARFPSLFLDMSVLPLTQRAQVMALNVGSRVTIASPPSWLPPDLIDLLVVGLKETISAFLWTIELVCRPFAPYRVAVADDAVLGRAAPNDGAATVTTTTGATSWSVATSSGPLWTTAAADFPFDVVCEGERVTVTNITGASSPQAWTVTRSVNGIVKAHTAAAVSLWQPMIAAL